MKTTEFIRQLKEADPTGEEEAEVKVRIIKMATPQSIELSKCLLCGESHEFEVAEVALHFPKTGLTIKLTPSYTE
jgi:hypothetical protein